METLEKILKGIAVIGSAIALSSCYLPSNTGGSAYAEVRHGQARAYAAVEWDTPRREDPPQLPRMTPARSVTAGDVRCYRYSHLDGTCFLQCNEITYTPDGRRSLSDPFQLPCQ